jgi:putative cell wall-binding protein
VHNIVVATGQNFPDALSAAGLAGTVESPILLVNKPGDPLPTAVVAEIERISSKDAADVPNATVWFVGGTGVLPPSLMTGLESEIPGITTARVAGADRYSTSAEVAALVHSLQGSAWTGKTVLATGLDYPDAQSGGSVAYGNKWTVLLTRATLPSSIANALVDEDYSSVYVVGGTGQIPDSVLTDIESLPATPSIDAARVAGGSTRYETAALFSRWAITNGHASPSYTGICTGQKFPDALAASGSIGTNGGVLILTRSGGLSPEAAAFLTDYRPQINKAVIFGGAAGAVSSNVFEQVSTILNP